MSLKFIDVKISFQKGDFKKYLPYLQKHFMRKPESTIKRILQFEESQGYEIMVILFTGYRELKECPYIPVGCVDWEINRQSTKKLTEITMEKAIEMCKEKSKTKRERDMNGYLYRYQ